jgi:PTH1 family peptidyl-tRNA hydrolase
VALVLGLGNPGTRYARTRHNVGWRVIEALNLRWKAVSGEKVPEYRSWDAEFAGHAVSLVRPQTFMNESGRALDAWRGRHDFEIASLLAVADDVYLPVGMLRLRARGSSGGHRGLESLERALGSREYARLRVGIGAAPGEELGEHVLDEFGAEEEPKVDESVRLAAEAVECWIGEGLLAAMNKFNRRVRKEVPES